MTDKPESGEVAALIERLRTMLSAFFSTAGQHNDLHRESMAMLAKQDDIVRTLERRVTHAERQLINAKVEIVRLSAPVPEWIPVGERLPDERQRVLAAIVGYDMFVADYLRTGWWDGPRIAEGVTHWMPLPPPPAADK